MPERSQIISAQHHLWSRSQMANAPSRGAPWDWLRQAFSAFEERLLHAEPEYPCHFGVHGHEEGYNSFAALDRRLDEFGVEPLARVLDAYREKAWEGPRRQSLIVFAGPPDDLLTLDDHRKAFWSILRGLRERDSKPWPADAPADPAHPAWQWCFGGEPWFVFAASPAHDRRRSRNLGPCLALVFQVRRVFEGLEGATTAGKTAKAQVRDRLRNYDALPPHPHLGDAECSSAHKWRQYFLPDDQKEQEPTSCPYDASSGPRDDHGWHKQVGCTRAGEHRAGEHHADGHPLVAHGQSATSAGTFTLVVADSIDAVGREQWDELFARSGGSVFYSYDFLASIEHRPLWNNAVAHYVLVRDGGGMLVGALPLYLQDDASPFDADAVSMPRPRVLLGHVWHCYDTTLLSRVPVDAPLAKDCWAAIEELAAELGAARWGLVNVPRRTPFAAALEAAGLTVEDAPPRYRLVRGGKPLTLDDHLAGVGRSSRRKLRQYARRAEGAGAAITFEQGSTVISDEDVLALVAETAAKYTPGYYDLEALAALIHSLGDRCQIMRVDLDGQLLATSICLFDDTRMHTWAGGCRYPAELNWSPQYVLFAAELQAGLAAGMPVLECGRRNDDFKRRYGLDPYPLTQVVARP